jgi:hypothetical protein
MLSFNQIGFVNYYISKVSLDDIFNCTNLVELFLNLVFIRGIGKI